MEGTAIEVSSGEEEVEEEEGPDDVVEVIRAPRAATAVAETVTTGGAEGTAGAVAGRHVQEMPVPEDLALRGTWMREYVKRLKEEAERLGFHRFNPHGPKRVKNPVTLEWEVGWPDFPTWRKKMGTVDNKRETYVGEAEWRRRCLYWPYCTFYGSDPLSETGPYPKGVEKWLYDNLPVKVALEIDQLPYYVRNANNQKVTQCWRFLFDYYPWFLAKQISRPPYLEDRAAQGLLETPLSGSE